MSFANYSTTHHDYMCVYCGNEHLVIDDSFDEHHNYCGTRYYCTCEKAKLEQEMKRKMDEFESEKGKIKKEYDGILEYNKIAIAAKEIKTKLDEMVRDFISYGDLHEMTKEDFLKLCEEAYDSWDFSDYENDEDGHQDDDIE